jgi:Phosphotransferase enzyme family
LADEGARVLADANNTVVLLPRAGVVAKVATSALAGRGGEALERELAIGRRLAERGAAGAAPLPGDPAGPHRMHGTVVTLWRHAEAGPRPADGDRLLGEVVRAFHAALAGMGERLPRLAETVGRARALVTDAAATPRLSAADRALCVAAGERLAALLDAAGTGTCLHGEPHEGNVIWTTGGPVLVDFEAACTGPLEWDLAYLPDAALDAFPELDRALVEALRPGVSLCVAAWCSATLDRGEEMRRAAVFHLDVVRRSAVAPTTIHHAAAPVDGASRPRWS